MSDAGTSLADFSMATAPRSEAFSDAPDRYEALVDWPKRLGREEPFFRRLFEQAGVRRILDAACGTGHHAAMFHSWGLEVEGADISPAMIARARLLHGEGPRLRWVVRSFSTPPEPAGGFDAVICTGNSLALAGDAEAVGAAVRGMLAGLRAGGLLVLHVLNLWQLEDGQTLWQKCRRLDAGGPGDRLLLKRLQRLGDVGRIDLIEVSLAGGAAVLRSDEATFAGLEASQLVEAVSTGGGTDIRLWGSWEGEPYCREQSVDLILAARRL